MKKLIIGLLALTLLAGCSEKKIASKDVPPKEEPTVEVEQPKSYDGSYKLTDDNKTVILEISGSEITVSIGTDENAEVIKATLEGEYIVDENGNKDKIEFKDGKVFIYEDKTLEFIKQ